MSNALKKRYFLFFHLILFSFIFPIFAQTYNFVNFTNNDGLPSLSITSITQDSLGFLFVGTQNGLSVFNGKHFMNFTKKNGLPNNYIVSIFPKDKRNVLVGTLSGLVDFDGENFNLIKLSKNELQNIVESYLNDGDSTLLGTARGVFTLKNNKAYPAKLFEKLKNRRIYTITKKDGKYFVGTDKGYAVVSKNSTKIYLSDHIVKNIYFPVIPNSRWMWLTTDKGILKVRGSKTIRYKKLAGVSLPGNFYCAYYDHDGSLWIGTHSGIIKFNENGTKVFNTFSGLPSNTINYLFKDEGNALWVGTDHGLSRLPDENALLFDRRHNVYSPVWNIIELGKNEYLVGTDGTGLLKLKNNKVTRFNLPNYSFNSIWGMYKDSKNNIWMDTEIGLFKVNGKSVQLFKSRKDFNPLYIFSIAEDKNHTIWLGSFSSGLYYYSNGSFSNLNVKDGLLSNNIETIRIADDNTIWVGTDKGINLVKNFKVVPFKYSKQLGDINVMDIKFAPDGNPLIATLDYGIYYIDLKKDKIVNISSKDGLSNNSVMFLAFDKDFNLWIGTNKGLNKFNYIAFISKGEKIIQPFSSFDGFLSAEANQGSELIDSQNILLYGSASGIVKFNLAKCNKFISKPKLFIYRIDVNFKPFLKLNPYSAEQNKRVIKLNYEQNYVTIHYSTLDLMNPNMIKFRYKLVGLDEKFSPITENTAVTYYKLAPGNYKFVVEAVKDSKTTTITSAQVSFSIAAPFWKTLWFYILVGAFVVAVIYLIFWLRINSLKKHAKALQQLYDEKVFYQKQLEESEKTYRELFEKSSDANLIIDPESLKIIDANHSAVKLYGYSLEKLRTMSLSDLSIDSKILKNNIQKVLNQGVATRLEGVHKREDGTEIQLSINASIVNYSGKKAILAIYTDVTKQKEIERKLKEAKEAAEKSNRLKSEFLAQVSHEIRTPINNILNYTNLIREEIASATNELLDMAFEAINRSSKRIIRTIDLILNMSELQRGTYEPSFKMIDLLQDVLMPLVEQYKFIAKDNNLEFDLHSNVKEARVFVDEYTVIQIFENLIENAIKYTKEGSVKLNLNYDINGKKCSVEVTDTGIGISQEYLPYIFEPFSQEEQGYTRRFDGNGLGLALVKSYCELNEAKIEVESQKGKGSTFRVIFKLD